MTDDSEGSIDASAAPPGSPKEITATDKHPYRSICALVCRWPEGTRVATGFLFGRHVVVTVGHALFDRKTGTMPLEVTVVPGLSRLKKPFAAVSAGPDRIRIFPDYRDKGPNEATAQDLGALLLREPVGKATGWRDLAPADLKAGDRIVLTGYPQSSLDEATGMISLMQDVGKVLERDRSLILHDAVGSVGQSGGPLWRLSDRSPYVMSCGMHTGNYGGRKGANSGLLFDWRHYNWIQARMREAEGQPFAKLDQFVASGANRPFGPRQAGENAETDSAPVTAKSARKSSAPEAEPIPEPSPNPREEVRFTVLPKGNEGIDLDLATGQILRGTVKIALAAGTFTDCDLVLEDEDGIPADHLPISVSSSGAEDFRSERFALTAQTDGRHRLVLKELNGVSAALVRLKLKPLEPAGGGGALETGEVRFTVPMDGVEGIDLDLSAGRIVRGTVKVALTAGPFTECDLALEDADGIAADHLPMAVSSAGADDFHAERFALTAQSDGPHRLVLKELNGVSAAIVRIKIKTD